VPVPYRDQVPRLERFRREHPEIEIVGPADPGTVRWTARQDGVVLATSFWLHSLLDQLDQLIEDQ
jgi:hypothetical protein